jgi:hypothetical protein
MTWSTMCSLPSTTKVMRLMPGASLWPTCRLSMLKLRRRSIPATRFSTPGLSRIQAMYCMCHNFSPYQLPISSIYQLGCTPL